MIADLRHSFHIGTAELLYHLRVARARHFIRRQLSGRTEVSVLGFHRVLSSADRARSNCLESMVVSEETFVKILEYLRLHCRVVPLDALLGEKPLPANEPKPWCLLTFDDGWRDNYTTAYPWLRKFGFPATIFLVTGFIGTRRLFWVDRLKGAWDRSPACREALQQLVSDLRGNTNEPGLMESLEILKRMPASRRATLLHQVLPAGETDVALDQIDGMLTWEQVNEMAHNGIEFGAHTVSHTLLTFEDDETVQRELRKAKQDLEEKLAVTARAFAYPNGDWDERIRRQVVEAGFACALTTCRGLHRSGRDPYAVRRILIHEGNVTGRQGTFSPAMLSLRLTGWR